MSWCNRFLYIDAANTIIWDSAIKCIADTSFSHSMSKFGSVSAFNCAQELCYVFTMIFTEFLLYVIGHRSVSYLSHLLQGVDYILQRQLLICCCTTVFTRTAVVHFSCFTMCTYTAASEAQFSVLLA
jgi:hypothetical protein